FRIRVVSSGARGRVPLPTMPGAHNLASVNGSLPQRTSAMEADVVHGRDGSIDVGDADGFVATGEFFGFVRHGKICLFGEFGEHKHSSIQFTQIDPSWLNADG